jgi:hypothetical protein
MVLRTFVAVVSKFLVKKARSLGITGTLKTGAITVIQRFGSSLNLNPHFHSAFVDGVYRIHVDGPPVFHPLPAPTDDEVAQVVAAVCRKVTRKLACLDSEDPIQDQPLLAALANASVVGRVATGARRGARVLRVGSPRDATEATIVSKRCAMVDGFNLHANVKIAANDRQGLEHLARYLARPPIASHRLKQLDDGRVALQLKRAFSDGTELVIFTPGELVEKLVLLVARPRTHSIRFHGFLAPASAIRSQIVPGPGVAAAHAAPASPSEPKQPSRARRRWAELLKRVFLVDVLDCPRCHGRMRVIAAVMQAEATEKILRHLGLPAEPPRILPPRAPPQADLFGAEQPSIWVDPPAADDFPA